MRCSHGVVSIQLPEEAQGEQQMHVGILAQRLPGVFKDLLKAAASRDGVV